MAQHVIDPLHARTRRQINQRLHQFDLGSLFLWWILPSLMVLAVVLGAIWSFPSTNYLSTMLQEGQLVAQRTAASAAIDPAVKGTTELMIYKVEQGRYSELSSGYLAPGDQLAFAYRNSRGRRHLMILAVTDSGKISWMCPSSSSGEALVIKADDSLHQLPLTPTPVFEGQSLTLYALFSDQPFSPPSVEAMISDLGPEAGRLPLENTSQHLTQIALMPAE